MRSFYILEFVPLPEGSDDGDFRQPFLEQRAQELNASVDAVLATAQGKSGQGAGALAEVLRSSCGSPTTC